MHIFTDYIQPLTLWLYAHPHMAILITFLISFGESLAIIGSLIPGSITMTAIGILAGSGVMRIDLTLLAATLGAIAGDVGSYALGYTFSDRLIDIWPFKRYPYWLSYGKVFFARHGATSVLIGRFVGPARSIIPLIAGMMHMNRWHFLLANVISAVGWAFLYIIPGVLIGIASSELSAESATRLFASILTLLVVIWLISLGIKWLLIHTKQFLHTHLHTFWTRLKHHPRLANHVKNWAPHDEVNHYPTAALTILGILCFFISITTIALVLQGSWFTAINNPVYLFLQSVRTQPFDTFFIAVSLIISPLPLMTLILAITIYVIYYRDWRTLRYWLSLNVTSSITIFLLTLIVDIPTPNHILSHHNHSLFPAIDLTLATSLFCFILFYISTLYRTVTMLILRILLLITLFLAGIAIIYLGDNWITSVIASYFIGLTLCILHWLFYRRQKQLHQRSQLPIILVFLILALASCTAFLLYFKKNVRSHAPHFEQYVMTEQVWWSQKQPLLPIYSTNRIGQRTGLMNIQYAGSIIRLQQAMEKSGWKRQSNTFFYSLLMRAGGHNSAQELPLMTQLYLTKRPALMMTYNTGNKQTSLVFRLWRSNYHLRHHNQPVWIGSVIPRPQATLNDEPQYHQPTAAYIYIVQALVGFKISQINLPKEYLQPLPHAVSPVLLIIKEPD